MIDVPRFPALPQNRMPENIDELRSLLALAFEEGDAAGAVKAYENVAEQFEGGNDAARQLASEARRFAGALKARHRRIRDDLIARGWGIEATR